MVDTADSKSVAERREGSSPSFATTMIMEREEQQKLVVELLTLVEGESHETEEYYHVLSDLHEYSYCMSDEFKEAFYNEVQNAIEFEKEWRASELEEG